MAMRNLKDIREEYNISLPDKKDEIRQDDIAKMVGLGKSNISKLENETRKPTAEDLLAYSKLCHVSLDYILDDKKEAFRVHGGGFAGTIQAFVLNENVEKYKKTMDSVFGPDSCHALKIRKYGGMRVM